MRTLKTLLGGVAFAATLAASSAQAQTTLLDLVNPAGQTNTPYVLSFMATSNVTTLTFAGYQVPSSETATGIGLYLADAGPNLLGTTWAFTPAPSGTLADQYNDNLGTGTNALVFAGVTTGSYDSFEQTIATAAGGSYSLRFLFSNSSSSSPSGFRVTTSADSVVPEPASWAMMVIGFGAMGASLRYRARRRTVIHA